MNEIESTAAATVGGDTYEKNETTHKTIRIINIYIVLCVCVLYIGYSISIHKTRAIIKALYSNHQASGCLMTKQRIDNGSRVYIIYVYVCVVY